MAELQGHVPTSSVSRTAALPSTVCLRYEEGACMPAAWRFSRVRTVGKFCGLAFHSPCPHWECHFFFLSGKILVQSRVGFPSRRQLKWRSASCPFRLPSALPRDGLLAVHPNLSEQAVPFVHLAHTPDLRAQARFTALVERAAFDQVVALLPPSDLRGRARLLSASSPGLAAWLSALPLYATVTLPDEVFRKAVHRLLGLLPPCLVGVTHCECGARHADPAELAAHMQGSGGRVSKASSSENALRKLSNSGIALGGGTAAAATGSWTLSCAIGGECTAAYDSSGMPCSALSWRLGTLALGITSIMPLLDGHHFRRGRPGGHHAGCGGPFQSGAFCFEGWPCCGERRSQESDEVHKPPGRRRFRIPGRRCERGFVVPIARPVGPACATRCVPHLSSTRRVRLSISLRRSMARTLHLCAGRALAAASGFRQGDCFPTASLSNLRLLTRVIHPTGQALRQRFWPLQTLYIPFGLAVHSPCPLCESHSSLLAKLCCWMICALLSVSGSLLAPFGPLDLVYSFCYHAAMEVLGIMPVLQKRGRPYISRLDVVVTPRIGGPSLLLDVVLIDAFQQGAPTPLAHHAERKKERHCNDHPWGDHFFSCAVDIYGGYETKWSSLLHRLALHVDARQRSRAGSLGHSSVPQVFVVCYRMLLSLSLQRSQTLAIHQRAGRALAQANGFRGGGVAPQRSLSDMHVLTQELVFRWAPLDQAVELLPPHDLRGRARLLSASSPGAAACLSAFPLRGAHHARKGLQDGFPLAPGPPPSLPRWCHAVRARCPPRRPCGAGCTHAPLRARGREDQFSRPPAGRMQGVFLEAGYKVSVEETSIMPIQLTDGQLHTLRADLVAIPLGAGPRIIAEVVTADCVDSANPPRSASTAGHTVGLAARGEERKYADHPSGDEFAALAIDVHGAFGSRWLDLLQRLARQAIDRQPGQLGGAARLQRCRHASAGISHAAGGLVPALPGSRRPLASRPRYSFCIWAECLVPSCESDLLLLVGTKLPSATSRV
eukprot:SM000025S08365  [mRNA]  locus=s25:291901:305203:+ [translate_table: standard]